MAFLHGKIRRFRKTVPALPALFFLIFSAAPSAAQTRSFDSFFPGMDQNTRAEVFSAQGFVLTRENSLEPHFSSFLPGSLELGRLVREKKPVVLVESLIVIPRQGVSLLDIYNALGRVQDLKGRQYHSFTRNRSVPLFEDAFRMASPQRSQAVPDPAPAAVLPAADTVYIRLKDNNFGPCFYQADFRALERGVFYSLENFRTIYWLVIPVMREHRFFARFYIEPVAEGVMIYCLAGADVSDFVADRISIPSAIEKRMAVFQGWVSDGLHGR